MRRLTRLARICLAITAGLLSASAQPQELRVWLLPSEPGVVTDVTDIRQLERLIDEFQHSIEPDGVIVENISDPLLRAQLLAWNPEFAIPNFGWLRGQTATIRALGRFAREHHVKVKVRFNTWANAFSELASAIRNNQLPDVAQIGSTWVGWLASQKALRPCLGRDIREAWRDLPGTPCGSLKYLLDVRLLFYWQQPPAGPMLDKPLLIDSSSWISVVESLRTSPAAPPFAMPIGLTYNVMHDLFPLFGANPQQPLFQIGPWTKRANLTNPASLQLPRFLAGNAVTSDDRGFPRRVIAFPEVTHEEAIRSFEVGGYVGIVEPVGYLSRWRESHRLQNPTADFWAHAGVVAPPTGLLGGSDLAVLSSKGGHAMAIALARFLATDRQYATTLAALGNLPAHNVDSALDVLVRTVAGVDRGDIIRQVSHEIRLALRRGQEYPSLNEWATEIENRLVLESVQRVWRRIAEGNALKVDDAVSELEQLINARIDPITIAEERIVSSWREASFVFALVMLALWWSSRRRAILLDHVRNVRGFSSSALATLDCVHYRRNPFPGDPKERDKAALIATGLVGLKRGLEEANWAPQILSGIVWRAIVMALDSIHDASLARRWQEQSLAPEVFLSRSLILRPAAAFESGDPPFYFNFSLRANPRVELPLMLEQALTCIIQNALKACKVEPDGSEAYYAPILIEIDNSRITVVNEVTSIESFSHDLIALINSRISIEEFDSGIQLLLQGPPENRPGIGLVEAYCIAALCYGGLSIRTDKSRVFVSIHLKRTLIDRVLEYTQTFTARLTKKLWMLLRHRKGSA